MHVERLEGERAVEVEADHQAGDLLLHQEQVLVQPGSNGLWDAGMHMIHVRNEGRYP